MAEGEGQMIGAGIQAIGGYATARMEAKEQRKMDALAAAREALNKQSQTILDAEETRRNRIMDIIGAFRQGVA